MATRPVLDVLRDLAGSWKGNGVGDDGEPFLATLAVRGALAGRGVALSFEARTEAKALMHAEELVCVPAAAEYDPPVGVYLGAEAQPVHLRGVPLEGVPGVALRTAAETGEGAFRIRFERDGDGDLIMAWDWDGPDGVFGERIRASLTRG